MLERPMSCVGQFINDVKYKRATQKVVELGSK